MAPMLGYPDGDRLIRNDTSDAFQRDRK
jgi:hypothetical protein